MKKLAMKKLLSVLTATILAAAFAMPLNAAPMFVPKPEQVRADVVEKVKQKWRHYGWHNRNQWRGDRPWDRQYAWRSCRYYGNCYPRRYYSHHDYYNRDYYPRYYRPHRPGVSIYVPLYRD